MSFEHLVAGLSLDTSERLELRKIILAAASQLDPADETVSSRFSLRDAARKLEATWTPAGGSPFVWRGFPPIRPQTLARLVEEARQQRRHAARLTNHLIAPGGIVAEGLVESAHFRRWVRSHKIPGTNAVARSHYHYYESDRDFAEPHLDKAEFAVSLVVLLEHRARHIPRSALFLCSASRDPCRLLLQSGEAILFEGDRVLHARSSPSLGEQLSTISFSYSRPDSPGTNE